MPVFQTCDPVWCPEAGHFLDPRILIMLLLAKSGCWSDCSYCIVLLKNTCARKPPPKMSSWSLMFSNPDHTASTLCLCGNFIPNIFSGTRNKSTALDLRCRTTLEFDVVFSQNISDFLGGYDWCIIFLSEPPLYPKFTVRSNEWKKWLICPDQFLLCLPSVRRWICIYRCLLRHRFQTTLRFTVYQHQLVVPWLRWTQWCTPLLHHETFIFASKWFEPSSRFQHHKTQSAPPTA